MTAEEVIVQMAGTAPRLSSVGVRLMLHVVATAIETGSEVVTITSRGAAASIGSSQDAMRRAVHDLARYIPAHIRDRQYTMFQLGPDWYGEQMRLPFSEGRNSQAYPLPGKSVHAAPKTQARCTENPGRGCTENPGTLPGKSVQDCGNVPSRAWEIGARCTENPGSDADSPIRNAPARVDRSIDQGFLVPEHILRIDKAFHTVEILPSQVEDAEILLDAVASYRKSFPTSRCVNPVPDRTVIARCLAVARIEVLCDVLRTLQEADVPPGANNMWFFVVLMNQIHGIPRKLISARISAQKSKARPYESKPSLFPDELVNGTVRQMRKLG